MVLDTPSGATPAPTGSTLQTVPGPTLANITITQATTAGAPGGTYYIITTYTLTSNESLPGPEFIVVSAAGKTPNINVVAAGAPAGATNAGVYAGLYSGGETLQQATRTTTALGTGFAIPATLINQSGLVRAASNSVAALAGLALHDSAAVYAKGIGGSGYGGPNNPLGVWANPAPLGPGDALQALVASFAGGQIIEMSLVQPFYPAIVGSAFGLTLDATSNFFVADTGATGCGTIVAAPYDINTQPGATGARVWVIFTPADVL